MQQCMFVFSGAFDRHNIELASPFVRRWAEWSGIDSANLRKTWRGKIRNPRKCGPALWAECVVHERRIDQPGRLTEFPNHSHIICAEWRGRMNHQAAVV